MEEKTNKSSNKKRVLHYIGIFAILFSFAFFFTIVIISNSYKYSQAYAIDDILVVIDPGHGGNDPGKVSVDNILEKDLNLQISFKLKKELENRGIETIILREDDVNLATEGATNKKNSDMKKRVQIINESGADCFVSIHQNSFTDPSVRGPQVFYNDQSNDSENFALLLQDKLNSINPEYGREEKSGNEYYILNKTVCPGVMVECGFLSCPEETALLSSEEYQQKIASAIADAIEVTY